VADDVVPPAEESAPTHPRPKGRGRPPTIVLEELLEVARSVFLEKGFRATTQEVAERAGVSEGSLFHHFGSKEALFRGAMNLDVDQIDRVLNEAFTGIDPLPLEDAISDLGRRLLEVGRVAIPLMMMTWSNPESCSEASYAAKKAPYKQLFYRIVGYFEEQVRLGRLRRLDSEVLARTFLGALHHYCMVRVIAPEAQALMIPESMFVRGLVDIVLHGALAPPEGEPGR
jgi:AcrR family transcriptional regulator